MVKIEWRELADGEGEATGWPYCDTPECMCHKSTKEIVFHLMVEEGRASVTCPTCGCSLTDYDEELFTPDPLRVSVKCVDLGMTYEGEHNGVYWEIHQGENSNG